MFKNDSASEAAILANSCLLVVAELFETTLLHYGAMREDELDFIIQALRSIEAGATADSLESEILDFKEDPAVHPRNRNPDASLVEFLIDEAVCFSNADNGNAFIVLGVADKKSGPEAFTGTQRELDWLIRKIFEGTQPNIHVEADELEWCGARLIVLRVPRGITLYQRPKGQASKRVGTRCVPLTEHQRRALFFERANPDYTSHPSRRGLEELDMTAVDQARHLLAQARAMSGSQEPVPATARELLGELGLLDGSQNPTYAAEILFMPPVSQQVTVRHLLRLVPGGEPRTTEISAPLITTYLRLKELIRVNAQQEVERIVLATGQEVSIKAFPDTAVDELVSNALAHRDWDASAAVVIDQSPIAFSVWSPGGLPTGVQRDRVLTTQSIPRNPRLMTALRMLGLAEESSRGFDRMWASMLSSGRHIPELRAEESFVEVILSSGRVDTAFVKALTELKGAFGAEPFDSVNGLIIARHLMDNQILLCHTAAQLMQVSEDQAADTLRWYESLGFVEQLREAREWILTTKARSLMGLHIEGHIAATSVQDWILAQLKEGAALTTREVAEELGVDRAIVTGILRHLRTIGQARIDPDGPQRGPNTRWVLS